MSSSELATSYASLILADEGIEITAEKINTLIAAAKIESVEPIWATLLAKALEGKNVVDMLSNVGAGGGAPAAGAAPVAAAAGEAAVEKKEEKVEEKEESDDDMGFGLFDLAVNDTTTISKSSDVIEIVWQPSGVFRTSLSRQLYADPIDNTTSTYVQNNVARGVLVHFSEFNSTQPPAIVPWIALISCDTNGTVYSLEDDVFTLCRDQGAQAALLYSTTSQGCQINQDYLQNFQKPISVYSTTSLQGARLIESQFANVGSNAYSFNSATLNSSQNAIETLLNSTTLVVTGNGLNTTIMVATLTNIPTSSANSTLRSAPTSAPDNGSSISTPTTLPTATSSIIEMKKRATTTTRLGSASPVPSVAPISYLVAVLAPADSTVGASPSPVPTASSSTTSNGGPTTSLAMIILYSITGIVSMMFLVVIMSGAIRALRNPERYGPRGGRFRNRLDEEDPTGLRNRPNQTIAKGLTRAILDTFPVVKFGSKAEETDQDRILAVRKSKEEGNSKEMELKEMENRRDSESIDDVSVKAGGASSRVEPVSKPPSINSPSTPISFLPPLPIFTVVPPSPIQESSETVTPIPSTSSETCPICVSDFLENEDIRILPCDRRHTFHPHCIDPWLLKFSSSCPLCRLDLNNGTNQEIPEEEEEAEREEETVREHLRVMLGNGRMNATASVVSTPNSGEGFSRNKFFRYVAARRASRS